MLRVGRPVRGCFFLSFLWGFPLCGRGEGLRLDRLPLRSRRPGQFFAQGQRGVFRVQQAPGAGFGTQADQQRPGRGGIFHHDQCLQALRRIAVAGHGAFQRSLAPGVGGAGPQLPDVSAAGIPERPDPLVLYAPDVQLRPCLSPFPLQPGKAADPRPHGAQQHQFLMKFRHVLFPLQGSVCAGQSGLCRTLSAAAHRLTMERRFFRRA